MQPDYQVKNLPYLVAFSISTSCQGEQVNILKVSNVKLEMMEEEWSLSFPSSVSSRKKNNRKVLLWLNLSGAFKQHSSSLPYKDAFALFHQSLACHQNLPIFMGKFILTSTYLPWDDETFGSCSFILCGNVSITFDVTTETA